MFVYFYYLSSENGLHIDCGKPPKISWDEVFGRRYYYVTYTQHVTGKVDFAVGLPAEFKLVPDPFSSKKKQTFDVTVEAVFNNGQTIKGNCLKFGKFSSDDMQDRLVLT